jgi:hypothetical protein
MVGTKSSNPASTLLDVFLKNDREKRRTSIDDEIISSVENIQIQPRVKESGAIYTINTRSPLRLDSPYPFTIDGVEWQTATAYIIASKFTGTKLYDRIQNSHHPSIAKMYGNMKIKVYDEDTRTLKIASRVDGEIILPSTDYDEHAITRAAVLARFKKYSFMKETLRNVTSVIDEHNPVHAQVLNELVSENFFVNNR